MTYSAALPGLRGHPPKAAEEAFGLWLLISNMITLWHVFLYI